MLKLIPLSINKFSSFYTDVNDFLKDSLLDLMLKKEYKFKALKFGLIRECRTKKGYYKNQLKNKNIICIINNSSLNFRKESNIYKIQKRNMYHKSNLIYYAGTRLLFPVNTEHKLANMSTTTCAKYKGLVAKKVANDGTGNHTHVVKNLCVQKNCEEKKCPTLCDTPTKDLIEGHNTHKPPIGRFCRFISSIDANGQAKAQYFVPTNEKKEITETEKINHSKEIKPDNKQQPFVNKHRDIYDQD